MVSFSFVFTHLIHHWNLKAASGCFQKTSKGLKATRRSESTALIIAALFLTLLSLVISTYIAGNKQCTFLNITVLFLFTCISVVKSNLRVFIEANIFQSEGFQVISFQRYVTDTDSAHYKLSNESSEIYVEWRSLSRL